MASSTLKCHILGCFSSGKDKIQLTPIAKEFDDKLKGRISKILSSTSFTGEIKKVRILSDLSEEFPVIAVTGLGEESAGYCEIEEIDMKKENIRCGIGAAIRALESYKPSELLLDDCTDPKATGEAATMCKYTAGFLKKTAPTSYPPHKLITDKSEFVSAFKEGEIIGEALNYARYLTELPANMKTPTCIAEKLKKDFGSEVVCYIRDKKWIEEKKMGMFLSVAQGSDQPPVLFEAHYKKSDSPPIILVGKGVTFDSGGISIKPSPNMGDMKGDMGGAACVMSTISAIAKLKLPVHVIGIVPFTENLPSGSATKPGDVFTAMNGMTVEVDNTDAEGRLILGDALTYADTFAPAEIIDFATLTGAVIIALGGISSAIYTTDKKILEDMKKAGAISGDRMWRMPMFKYYRTLMDCTVADITNASKKREGGSCSAAAFLKDFVKTPSWAHLDIAGSAFAEEDPYTCKGMSGRPTRAVIEYLKLRV